MNEIPFVDLKAQYRAHRDELDNAIARVLESTAFIGGEYVRGFEKDFERHYGVDHCISVANGTDAIYITLKMLGIGVGDEVITVANSWISTSEAVTQAGARPVFVDVDDYFHIDVSQIRSSINARTKAIIPVHIYGQAVDMREIVQISEDHDLLLIEDCAQAIYAESGGQRVGTFGVAGTLSFYPGKNLGAYGDAGAIITNDDAFATKVRMYANHGALIKHHHIMEGINSRLDGLQASILSAKLPHVPEWNRKRQEIAARYDSSLQGIDEVTIPARRPDATHVYHLYVIRVSRREELQRFLADRAIQTAVHYPTALPLLPAYEYMGHTADDFPRAYENQTRILSLPMFAELSLEDVDRVCNAIREFYS